MTQYRSEFLRILHTRGFIHQGTDLVELDNLLCQGIVPAYIGFDATAASLHAGSLIQIMKLMHLQRCGHKPIVLMGGGTTKIGDPTGKDTSRQLLTPDIIQKNIAGIKKCFAQFLSFGDGATDAIMLNNDEWLDALNYLDFLRDYGRHFSVNRMLTFDSVRLRLEREHPLSFLEFNYMILQAYDFVELNRRYGCRLQMGGSDQWGNIVNGVELGRRVECASLFGLTSPLLTTATGNKMGKTSSGAVWISPDHLSPYEYWQYWRNTHDADVIRFLKLFTLLPLEEIDRYGRLQGAELNDAKRRLADEATTLVHGAETLPEIHQTVDNLFSAQSSSQSMEALEEVCVTQPEIAEGVLVTTLLQQAGLTTSNSEGRRLIRGRAVRWNGTLIENEMHRITQEDFTSQNPALLSSGKKKHVAIKMNM